MTDPTLAELKAELARTRSPRVRTKLLRQIDVARGLRANPKPKPPPYRYKSRYSSYYDRDRTYW